MSDNMPRTIYASRGRNDKLICFQVDKSDETQYTNTATLIKELLSVPEPESAHHERYRAGYKAAIDDAVKLLRGENDE